MLGIVYLITNTLNGKQYVGFTSRSLEDRWWCHVNGGTAAAPKLHNAIKKHGAGAFTKLVVFRGTADEALQKEIELIKTLKTVECGYNLSVGGESGFSGCHHSQESRDKIRAALTKPGTNRHRVVWTEEMRLSASARTKGRPGSFRGKKHSPETIAKLRQANMGNKKRVGRRHSDDSRAKMSRSHTGSKLPKEHIEKIRTAMAQSWERRREQKEAPIA